MHPPQKPPPWDPNGFFQPEQLTNEPSKTRRAPGPFAASVDGIDARYVQRKRVVAGRTGHRAQFARPGTKAKVYSMVPSADLLVRLVTRGAASGCRFSPAGSRPPAPTVNERAQRRWGLESR
jgi:hypothetical protein